MTKYNYIPFDLIQNKNFDYYKLVIENICHIDDFIEQVQNGIKSSKEDKQSFEWLLNLMERFSPTILLPKTKFRQIQSIKRDDVFEFKKNNLRIYVIVQRPNIYVAMGGYKRTQDKDIKVLGKRVKDFPTE